MNALTPIEAHRRAERVTRELNETYQIKALGEAATHLAKVRLETENPFSQKLLWAEFHFTKALKDHHGEDVGDAFQIACDNLGVDEHGEPITDPDDYDEFAQSPRRSVWGQV